VALNDNTITDSNNSNYDEDGIINSLAWDIVPKIRAN